MPHRAALLALVLALLGALVPAAAQAATERVRITWNTETDIDLHVYDEAGNHAYYLTQTAIPNATLSSDNTVGFGPESFTDDDGAGAARTFNLSACYYPSIDAGPTVVTATITDGNGASRTASVTLAAPSDCAELGISQGSGSDTDGDGILDGADQCPTQPAPGTADGCPPPENRPPIAVSDRWEVRAGHYVYDNALKNDRDPDGDSFTPRVTSISFRAAEWSGMERDGTFNYVAGAGTRIHQRKVITYHLVDSRGARSAPATITIDVIPPGKRGTSSPVRGRGGARSSVAPRWYGNKVIAWACFGSGFDRFCYGVLSPAQTQALNATTPWISRPSASEAARACALAFRSGGAASCAANLVGGVLTRAGDKQIIRVAAQDGDCLLFKMELNRTPRHPLAGSWSKPEYHPIHSYLRKGTWGTWGKWRVPVSCTAGSAWMQLGGVHVRR
jgi:hypothetical protein